MLLLLLHRECINKCYLLSRITFSNVGLEPRLQIILMRLFYRLNYSAIAAKKGLEPISISNINVVWSGLPPGRMFFYLKTFKTDYSTYDSWGVGVGSTCSTLVPASECIAPRALTADLTASPAFR